MSVTGTATGEPTAAPDRPPSWRGWFFAGAVAAMAVGVGVAFVFSFVGLFVALFFVFAGLAYGIVGMVVIGIRWATLPMSEIAEKPAEVIITDVHLFRTDAQRFTLVLNVLLLVNLAIAAVMVAGTGELFSAILPGGVAEVAGAVLIAANAVWAYGSRHILGEQEAMDRRVGRYRLIRTNRVLSYVVWSLYTVVAALLVLSVVAPSETLFGGPGF